MKILRILLTLICFFLIKTSAFAQTLRASFFSDNVYKTYTDLEVVKISDRASRNRAFYNDTITIKSGLAYQIVNEDENGYVIIRVLPRVKIMTAQIAIGTETTGSSIPPKYKTINIIEYSDETPTDPKLDGSAYYYSVKKDKFKPFQKAFISEKIIGQPLIHPLKLRPGKGSEGWNLTGDFTLTYTVSFRFRVSKNPLKPNYISLVPYGLGVGAAKYFRENDDGSLTEKKETWSVTYYQGGAFMTIKKVNFGVFVGFDAMIDKQNKWFYQSKPWFSLGFGYKFKTD